MVEFGGKTYSSPPLVNEEEIFAEWRIFKRALAKEKKTMMEKKEMSKPLSLQDDKMWKQRWSFQEPTEGFLLDI